MGGCLTFCAPILVDGKYEDAFRRDVTEVGCYPEQLEELRVSGVPDIGLIRTPFIHPHIHSRPSWMVYQRSRQQLGWVLCRDGPGVLIIASFDDAACGGV